MNKMIQIRNVPERLHRELKAKAARLGLSLSDYALSELKRSAKRPSVDEIFEDLRKFKPIRPKIPIADLVRLERDRDDT
jgi:plasmid stability protein